MRSRRSSCSGSTDTRAGWQGDETGEVRLVEEALVVLADRGEIARAGDGRGDPGLVFVQADGVGWQGPAHLAGEAQALEAGGAGVADRVPDAVDEDAGVEVRRSVAGRTSSWPRAIARAPSTPRGSSHASMAPGAVRSE